MNTVNIARCSSYQYSEVEKAIFQCLDGIPALKERIQVGKRVLVKVNLLKGSSPEEAITTHPCVVEAIVRYLQALGCAVVIGDSPGSALNFNQKLLHSVYKITGMVKVAENTGCELNYDCSVVEVVNQAAQLVPNMQVIKLVQDVDFVVSAAKLKTHAMMTYTGAVKNLFGIIPGRTKIDYHLNMNNAANFAVLLVDICEYVKPIFSVIDAVEGMEGDGPAAGDKRQVGLVLAAQNPYALDLAALHIIGMNPADVPAVVEARRRGISGGSLEDIEIQGLPLQDIKLKPFRYPVTRRVSALGGKIPRSLENFILNRMRPKPVFDYNTCISCGLCAENCPPHAIRMLGSKPIVNFAQCIRCFCCHELCPKKAVHIKRNWLYEKILK